MKNIFLLASYLYSFSLQNPQFQNFYSNANDNYDYLGGPNVRGPFSPNNLPDENAFSPPFQNSINPTLPDPRRNLMEYELILNRFRYSFQHKL